MYNSKICKKLRISLYFAMVFIPIGVMNSGLLDDPLYNQMYESYKRALNIDEGTVSARRVFSNNKNYEIHVMKLSEVNGKKRHNLLVKESNATNPLIYIDNPVETKVPNAYLTLEEFKKQLSDRVLLLRQQFVAKTSKAVGLNLNLTKEKPLDEDRGVKKFNIFLDRLIYLRDDKRLPNVTKAKSKENKKRTGKFTKTISKENKNFISKNTKAKIKQQKNETAIVTEATKKETPVFRTFALETNAETTVKSTKKGTVTVSEQTTDKSNITEAETTNTVEMETTMESPTTAVVTEHLTEPEVTKDSLKENPEPTREIEFDLTTRTTTEEITTRQFPLGAEPRTRVLNSKQRRERSRRHQQVQLYTMRPLVWDGGDEKQSEYE